jgi:hypothetical protein
MVVTEEIKPGHFKDTNGEWQEERRSGRDRRSATMEFPHRDRRTMGRRKADMEFLERDTRQQIEEALEDFAAEHNDHP